MPKTQLINRSQIAERAFEIWEHEGKPHGRDQEHWQRAEIELRETMSRMTKPAGKRAGKAPVKAAAKSGKAKAGKTARAKA
jgi:hypothetical protein